MIHLIRFFQFIIITIMDRHLDRIIGPLDPPNWPWRGDGLRGFFLSALEFLDYSIYYFIIIYFSCILYTWYKTGILILWFGTEAILYLLSIIALGFSGIAFIVGLLVLVRKIKLGIISRYDHTLIGKGIKNIEKWCEDRNNFQVELDSKPGILLWLFAIAFLFYHLYS